MGKGFRLGWFVFGGAVGAVIALLYAPRSGEETRAIVADKAADLLGQGQTIYVQGRTKIKEGIAAAQPVISKKSDELREKIENARTVIAEQVVKNAAVARDVISEKIPVAGEKIHQAVDVVKGQIDAAATKLRETAASNTAKDVPEAAGQAPAGEASAE